MAVKKGYRASSVLGASILGLFLLAAVGATLLTDRDMRHRAREEAAAKARLMLDQNLAVHTYFSHELKPELFELLPGEPEEQPFEPALMSSSFAVRRMNRHLASLTNETYYYKECAVNARSPENEADAFEAAFLEELNRDPKLVLRTVERELDGKPYLAVLRRGETMEASCMRCHDTPGKAPAEMVAQYGAERSFGRTPGEVVSAVSVRIPLAHAYADVNRQTAVMAAQFGGLLVLLFLGHLLLTRKLLLRPLSGIREKALAIATGAAPVGETLEEPPGLEFAGVARAFNEMSVALRRNRDALEDQVRIRTADLAETNKQLEREIEEHRLAESQVHRFTQIMESSLNEIYLFDSESLLFLEVNRGARENLGYSIEELRTLTPIDIKPELSGEAFQETLLPLWSNPSAPIVLDTIHQRKDGSTYPVEAHVQLLEGDPPVYAAIIADITERKRQEASLKESEERFRLLFDNAPLAYQSLNAEGNLLEVNRAWCESLGYTRDEVLGRNFSEFIIPEHAGKFIYNFPCFKEQGQISGVEFEMVRSDENRAMVSFHGRVARYPDGSFKQTHCIFQDVTDRHKAEVALRESERRYRTLFSEMLDGFALHEIICDDEGRPTNYCFLEVNPAFERFTGLKAANVVGKTVLEVIPGIEPHWIKTYGEVALSGEPAHFEQYAGSMERYFEVTAFQTAPGRFATIFVDITERKRDEEALREREERFRALFEQAGDWCLILEPQPEGFPIIVEANAGAFEAHGMTREELVGQPLSVLCPDEQFENMKAHCGQLMQGEPRVFECVHQRKDGATFPVEVSAKLFQAGDSEPLVFTIERDISERRSLENQLRQSQKLEAVGQLAGGVAHDFNNLLYVIQGYAEMAVDSVDDGDPVGVHLGEVLKASERAANLVRQLLAFSRRQVLSLTSVDLNELVEDLLKMLQRVIGEHIQLHFIPGHGLGIVRADRGQIEQVLMNLCVNARDAMPEGGSLTIETENVLIDEEYRQTHTWSKPGRYVLICVTDTGHGMDEQTLASVFEPFFTTKGPGEGTGLGLSMVYGLVKQHDGIVNAYSEPGKGTTFKVYLPIVARSASAVGSQIQGPVPVGTETVLLAEDDDSVRELSSAVLARAGYRALAAADGEEAVRLFEEHAGEIDLAILDVMMPGLGGRAVYEKIRAMRPGVKVLFSSGYSMNAIHTNFVLDEGLMLLQKPYRREALLRKVRAVLDGDGLEVDGGE